MNEAPAPRPDSRVVPPPYTVSCYVLGRLGAGGCWWVKDLDELVLGYQTLTPGPYWVRWLRAGVAIGGDLAAIRSTGARDWGFLHVRPGGGFLLGAPGAAPWFLEALDAIRKDAEASR